MFTLFNSENLWIGTDMKRLAEIRSILKNHSIPYKYKVRNRLGRWSGKGTLRGTCGSAGNPPELMYQYEIFVYKKDFEQAKYLINYHS